jgi:hypothetical protein
VHRGHDGQQKEVKEKFPSHGARLPAAGFAASAKPPKKGVRSAGGLVKEAPHVSRG